MNKSLKDTIKIGHKTLIYRLIGEYHIKYNPLKCERCNGYYIISDANAIRDNCYVEIRLYDNGKIEWVEFEK